jgi:hypothetical protein
MYHKCVHVTVLGFANRFKMNGCSNSTNLEAFLFSDVDLFQYQTTNNDVLPKNRHAKMCGTEKKK